MARGKKGIDGVDKVIDLFPAGSHKMIERLLARAAERNAKTAGRNVKRAMSGSRAGRRLASNLAAELGRALRHRGDVGGNKASIRQKAPDGGGRPFHFAHSVINKEDAAPAASGKASASSGNGTAGGQAQKVGKAAAHMRYIEREIAVERTYGQELDGRGRDDGSWDREVGKERAGAEGPEREGQDQVHVTGASAGQGYIENPTKLANGEQIVFSFGTIGEKFEDRVAFWEALEEAEAHPSARVQHRLIVELPHEASAQARYDIVKAFTKRLEDDGVPYWAALHAPGKDNDSRNFHAHVVYSERPARRMVDPDAPGAPEKWDFEIVREWTDSSRHRRESRPHRQEKLRSYHARDFIPTVRQEFSEAVNAVLVRDDVKDRTGEKVRYDARSYKDMGVDVVPMRSINRIVADKLKDGKLTVLDGDYTKRMIAAELREAFAKRQKGVMELIALDEVLRATAESRTPLEQNSRLPKELRISPWANPSRVALRVASRKLLEARHAALHIDVMERATTASLERIIAATTPKAVAAAANARDPIVKGEAPSAERAGMLQAAALDELADTKASTAKARRTMAYRVGNAVNEWKALVGAPPPEISPAVKAAIRQMDQREAQAKQGNAQARQTQGQSVQAHSKRTPARSNEGPSRGMQHGAQRTPAEHEPERAAAAGHASTTSTPTTKRDTGETGHQKEPQGGDARTAQERTAAVSAQITGRAQTPRAKSDARGSSQAALRPRKMEDSLKVGMPPTVTDWQAASSTVSAWIKTIADGEPDVDRRMRRLDAFVADLKTMVRDRQGRSTQERPAKEGAKGQVTPSTAPGEADAAQSMVTTTPMDSASPTIASPVNGPEKGDVRTRSQTEAPATKAPRAEVPREATSEVVERRAEPSTTGDTTPAGQVAGKRTGATDPATPQSPSKQVPRGAADEPQDQPEHPDDVRRRKKRQEEIEKRKRQRQAVLARQNRGRDR